MDANLITSDSATAYDQLARFYDLQHATFTPDLDMYRHFATACRERFGHCSILEIGCGTGRVMVPLVQDGFSVVGVDESPRMLQVAREHLLALSGAMAKGDPLAGEGETGPHFQLVQADIHTAQLEGRFGLAFIALNTFLHNLTTEDQLAMLATAHRSLLPDGKLLVDLPPNDELACQPDDGEYEFEATLVDPSTGTVIDKFVASRVSLAEQTQTLSYRIDEKLPGGRRSQTITFRLRHVFRHEMELLLMRVGFNTWNWYGDYDLSPYTDGSPRMIVAAA